MTNSSTLSISAQSPSMLEGTGSSAEGSFRIDRAGDHSGTTSVNWFVTGVAPTGVGGNDFVGGILPTGTITFLSGEVSRTIKVMVAGDNSFEADETFQIGISSPDATAGIATGLATVTVINDDSIFSIAATTASLNEGHTGTTPFEFAIERQGAVELPASVTWTAAGSGTSPANPADFTGGIAPSGISSFAADETIRTITVLVAGESTFEPDEDFIITLSKASTKTNSAIATIRNDDAGLSIAPAAARRAEGQSGTTPFTFTVTRSGVTTGPATAKWAVTGIAPNGAGGFDFAGGTYPSGTVAFIAGQTSETITVLVAGDTAIEAHETFQVMLSSPSAGTGLVAPAAQGIILDDDQTSVISILEDSQTPNTGQLEGHGGVRFYPFTVMREGPPGVGHEVDWAVTGEVNAFDFFDIAGKVTIGATSTSATILLQMLGDQAVEAHEKFTVTIATASPGAVIGAASATGFIVNDDTLLSVAVGKADRAEGTGAATPFTFAVTRTGLIAPYGHRASWSVKGTGATPANAGDFVAQTGFVDFAPLETEATVTVLVAGDASVEPDEGFTLTLSAPLTVPYPDGKTPSLSTASSEGVAFGLNTAIGLIRNDDATGPAPMSTTLSIAAANASRPEGHISTTAFSFLATRVGDINEASSATWTVTGSGVSPAAASDFAGGALPTGTVSFTAGQTSKTITVNVAGDSTVEPNEGFTVTLSALSAGLALGAATALGSIQNDDATLAIASTAAAKSEGNSGTSAFTFTVTRSGNTTGTSSAAWAVTGSGVSPAAGSDFAGGALPTGTVSFTAGQTSQTITVNVAGDSTVEPNEGFTVSLSGASAGTSFGTATAGGTIVNDDISATPAMLSITPLDAERLEGSGSGTQPFTFVITRGGDLGITATASWSVVGLGPDGTGSGDFAGGFMPGGGLSFAPGEVSKTITVNVVADSTIEGEEEFALLLSAPSAGTLIDTAAAFGSILNDDAAYAIAATSARKPEETGGTTPFTFTVTRSGGTAPAGSVAWSVLGMSGAGTLPSNAADFAGGVLPSGVLAFEAGQTSQILTIDVAADSLGEMNERFLVLLSAPSGGATLAVPAAGAIIFNDDNVLSIAATGAVKPEGTGGTTPFTFAVTRNGTSGTVQSVNWAVSGAAGGGTTPATASDFLGGVFPSGTLTFAVGETSKVITVAVAADAVFELSERFAVTLTNPTAGAVLGTAAADGIILNDDSNLSVAPTAANKAEGNSGATPFTFTVTRGGVATGAASAKWAASGSGAAAAAASDFTDGVYPSGTVSFAAGETSKTVTVNVAGDTLAEANEGFTVTLDNPVGAALGTAAATGTILNDDGPPGAVLAVATGGDKAEGTGGTTPFTFTVTRTGPTALTDRVKWSVTGVAAGGR